MDFVSFPVQYVGYKVRDQIIDIDKGTIVIDLYRKDDKDFCCYRCGTPMKVHRGQHRLHLKEMSVMGFKVIVHLFRQKGHCEKCKKARSEVIEFLSEETPHATKHYSFWLGKLCEIATVKQSSWFANENQSTTWRADLERMERMLRHYHIPPVTAIAVDEVYMGKLKEAGENRNDRFFTVITDLTTHKVIWIEPSRSKKALDAFFKSIGIKGCNKIKVVATDQHEDYIKSTKEYCKNAQHVLDRFHVMKNFEEAINECRKLLRKMLPISNKSELYLDISGKYRFIFLKRASKRTSEEQKHIEKVCKENKMFLELEIIKERMITFFDAKDANEAELIFLEVRKWIIEAGFPPLKRWWENLSKKWDSLKNYFTFKVTTALSEGVNNVIKSLKRRSFGFRSIRYFGLKILQRCGFVNSMYMNDDGSMTFKSRKLFGYKNAEYFSELSLF